MRTILGLSRMAYTAIFTSVLIVCITVISSGFSFASFLCKSVVAFMVHTSCPSRSQQVACLFMDFSSFYHRLMLKFLKDSLSPGNGDSTWSWFDLEVGDFQIIEDDGKTCDASNTTEFD